jgi:hypothetical protein
VLEDGVYYDDLRSVAKTYVYSGAFLFDMVTSIPETMVEISLRAAVCGAQDNSGDPQDIKPTKVVQLLRPLRIFRLMRITGLVHKMNHLDDSFNFQVMLDQLHIPTAMSRMLKSLLTIAFVIHTCTCLFWLVKSVSCSEEEISAWLEMESLSPGAGLSDRYLISCYLINTIFTTVGFGDIVPTNQAERVFYIIVMHVVSFVAAPAVA